MANFIADNADLQFYSTSGSTGPLSMRCLSSIQTT